MATGGTDLKLTAGIDGADEVGKAAQKALSPWEAGAKKVGNALKSAFTDAVKDVGKLVLLSNAISLDKAFSEARKYRTEIGLLSSTGAGSVGGLRAQLESLSKTKLIRESDLVAATTSLGRMTYTSKTALSAMGALTDEAQATGETLQQKLPLGAALMGGMGIAANNVGDELDRVHTLADRLGTSGGLLAAEDRLTAMSGLLSEIGAKSDGARGKFEAMALGLGKGLSPEQGKRAAGTILSTLSGQREKFAAIAGMNVNALTDKNGNVNVENMMQAAEKTQAWVRRQSKDRGMQQMIAASLFGGDRQAGAAFLNADFADIRMAAAKAAPTGTTALAANVYRTGEAGRAEQNQQNAEREARKSAESLLPMADAVAEAMAKHPISGGILGNMGLNLGAQGVGAGLGGLLSLIGGKGGGKVGGALGVATGAVQQVYVTNWPGGGLGGGPGGVGGGPGMLGTLGTAAGALSIGMAIGAAADQQFGISDYLSGTGEHWRPTSDVTDTDLDQATKDKINQQNAALHAKIAEYDKYGLTAEKREAIVKSAGGDDSKAVEALARALATAKFNATVVVENHTESPHNVNAHHHAHAMKN